MEAVVALLLQLLTDAVSSFDLSERSELARSSDTEVSPLIGCK